MINSDSTNGSLFAPADIERWRNELKRLQKQRETLHRQINALERILSGADMYASVDGDAEADIPLFKGEPKPAPEPEPPATMHDAILQIARNNPGGLEPKDFAAAIRSDGRLSIKIKQSHPNYLYTAIARLVSKEQLIKAGALYKPTPQKV
jgi:hypothetical protein